MTQIIATNNTMVVVNGDTNRRANVIARRTGSNAMGVVKAQMIDLLKEKLRNGVAHFVFLKKNGEVREAWGTCNHNLMKAKINGRGIDRDSVNCVCYWDLEKGAFDHVDFDREQALLISAIDELEIVLQDENFLTFDENNKIVLDKEYYLQEETLDAFQSIISSPRNVIREDELIVDIAYAKKTGSDSVRHLATHTSLVEAYDSESGDVRPNKIRRAN